MNWYYVAIPKVLVIALFILSTSHAYSLSVGNYLSPEDYQKSQTDYLQTEIHMIYLYCVTNADRDVMGQNVI